MVAMARVRVRLFVSEPPDVRRHKYCRVRIWPNAVRRLPGDKRHEAEIGAMIVAGC
jgi:hypothetical protein